jgi:hypothetical protein
MSRVLISIITNRKKEDSENAISNDLETPNFQNFSGPLSLTSFLPPEWPSCGIYINIPCKLVHLTDQIRSINAQCNVTLYIQKSVSENAHISVLRVEKYKKFLGENTPRPTPLLVYTYHTKLFVTNNHLSSLHTQYSMVPFCRCPPPRQVLKKSPVFKSFRCMKTGHGLGLW